jgi:hypothetical protein
MSSPAASIAYTLLQEMLLNIRAYLQSDHTATVEEVKKNTKLNKI